MEHPYLKNTKKNLKYMDDEEKSLHLLHRNKSYVVGHGCAVSWDLNEGNCKSIYRNFSII